MKRYCLNQEVISAIDDCRIIQLPQIVDDRGNLTFVEAGRSTPFIIRGVYWIYNMPGAEVRGGHANKKSQEFFISLSGSFDVVLDDVENTKVLSLNHPSFSLYVPNMIWHRLENFSTNAICLILTSLPYSEEDYLRDYELFIRYKETKR